MKESSRGEGCQLRRRLVAGSLALAFTMSACVVERRSHDKGHERETPTTHHGATTTAATATTAAATSTTAGPSVTTTTALQCSPAVGAGAPAAVARAMAETVADVGDDLACASDVTEEAPGGLWWQWFPQQAALVVGTTDGRGSVLYGPSVAALVEHDPRFSETHDLTRFGGVPITRMDCFDGDVIAFLDGQFRAVALLARPNKRNGKEAAQPILVLPAMMDQWASASRSLDTFIFPTSETIASSGTISQQFGSFGARTAPESALPKTTVRVDEIAHLCGRGDVPLLPSQVFPR